jgi:Flp pilus assembly pilin Flp
MRHLLRELWSDGTAQDIAEYAMMLAVILVLVAGTIRLGGSNSNTVFSSVAGSIQYGFRQGNSGSLRSALQYKVQFGRRSSGIEQMGSRSQQKPLRPSVSANQY